MVYALSENSIWYICPYICSASLSTVFHGLLKQYNSANKLFRTRGAKRVTCACVCMVELTCLDNSCLLACACVRTWVSWSIGGEKLCSWQRYNESTIATPFPGTADAWSVLFLCAQQINSALINFMKPTVVHSSSTLLYKLWVGLLVM